LKARTSTDFLGVAQAVSEVRGLPRAMPHTPEPPYGRVTNAARFAMLHRVALELLDRLHDEFDVERIEASDRNEYPLNNSSSLERLTGYGTHAFGLFRVVLDDEDSTRRRHLRFAEAHEPFLIHHVVERIGHQDWVPSRSGNT
jgi:hypothetical protein